MITVHVNLREHPVVSEELLHEAVHEVLASEGIEVGEISVTLLDDPEISDLNARYLGRDRPTDVLSFGLHDAPDPPLGDVYLGVAQAMRQANEHGVPVAEELVRLAIHGTLHVLGYDHPDSEDRYSTELFRKQERLVAALCSRSRPRGEPDER